MISRYDSDQRTGPSVLTSPEKRSPSGQVGKFTVILSWFGALVSIALMAGIGYWAISLGSRSPSDIPVLRAMDGHARTRPVDPGGLKVGNQGLSINQVIESGIAAEASDTVVLAPRSMPLDPGDTVTSQEELFDQAPVPATRIAGETAPTEATGTEQVIEQASAAETVEPQIGLEVAQETEGAAALPRPRPNGLGIAPLEDGALVVHLGSYGSYQVAEKERVRLITDHGDLIGDLPTLIQSTEVSGVTSYSIAAVGFEDQVASRNLCTSLLERGTQCIPAQHR